MRKVGDIVWDHFTEENVKIIKQDDNTIPTTFTVLDSEGMEYFLTEDDMSDEKT